MISSAKNPKVTEAARLRKRAMREREQRFLSRGRKGSVRRSTRTPPAIERLFVQDDLHELAIRAKERGIDVVHASAAVLARLTSTVTPQGIVGVAPFVDVPVEHLPPPDASRCCTRCAIPGTRARSSGRRMPRGRPVSSSRPPRSTSTTRRRSGRPRGRCSTSRSCGGPPRTKRSRAARRAGSASSRWTRRGRSPCTRPTCSVPSHSSSATRPRACPTRSPAWPMRGCGCPTRAPPSR